MLALGKTVDESIRALSMTNPASPIAVSDALTEHLEKRMAETVRGLRVTKAYLRAKAKHDQEKQQKGR
jgi:pyrroloquinoline quinone (PQQ) biosynthesis protein C